MLVVLILCLAVSALAAPTASTCNCLDLPLTIPQDLCTFRPCSNYLTQAACNNVAWCVWSDTTNQNLLSAHGVDFNQTQIVQVTQPGQFPQVYSAIGFGLSNTIVVVGNSGYFIVDTSESVNASALIRAAVLATLGVKPVVAIAYTHSHSDHVSGVASWLAPFPPYLPAVSPPIYAHATWQTNLGLDLIANLFTYERSFYQFGSYLTSGFINDGIGPRLFYDPTTYISYAPPTITFQTSLTTQIDGYNVNFFFAPGENGDEINIQLPDVGVVIAGDNIYDAFPDVYAIRGVRARSPRDWWNSIDLVRDLAPVALALTHTQPIIGSALVQEKLQVYRDMIQFTHDQTLIGLTNGLPATYLARTLTLPAAISEPLQFYGTLGSSVLAVNNYYVGWWDGQISELEPLDPYTQGLYLIDALDGPFVALVKAEEFISQKTPDATRFALQILEAILNIPIGIQKGLYSFQVNPLLIPTSAQITEATTATIVALKQLGIAETSSNFRNTYLSSAQKLAGGSEFAITTADTAIAILDNPISLVYEFLPLKFNVTLLLGGLQEFISSLPAPLQPLFTPLETQFSVLTNLSDAGIWTSQLRAPSQVAEIRQPSVITGTFPLIITTSSIYMKEVFIYAASDPAIITQLIGSGAIVLTTGFQTQLVQFVTAEVTPSVTSAVTTQVTAAVEAETAGQGLTQSQIGALITAGVEAALPGALTTAITAGVTTLDTAILTGLFEIYLESFA